MRRLLLLGAVLLFSGCAVFRGPNHTARFRFEGTVVDSDGKPVSEAWVKVRGWETLTDIDGRWRQEQLVDCGALKDHPASYDEPDAILVTADGFHSAEEGFLIKHPAWFAGCKDDQNLVFETKLSAVAKRQNNRSEIKNQVPSFGKGVEL